MVFVVKAAVNRMGTGVCVQDRNDSHTVVQKEEAVDIRVPPSLTL